MATKEAMADAKLRQLEIARKTKAQRMLSSGYVPSQHGYVTSENRLIRNGHYSRHGRDLELNNLRDTLAREKRIKREERAKREYDVVLVKRQGDKTLYVEQKTYRTK